LFAIALLIALLWTTLFSLTIKPGIRGFRNFGLLAAYLMLPIFLFVAGWKLALSTWVIFGLSGGFLYFLWEVFQYLRSSEPDKKLSGVTIVHGLFGWPIMVPEAIEYALAEAGILKSAPVKAPEENGEKPQS
jgi:cyanate permease